MQWAAAKSDAYRLICYLFRSQNIIFIFLVWEISSEVITLRNRGRLHIERRSFIQGGNLYTQKVLRSVRNKGFQTHRTFCFLSRLENILTVLVYLDRWYHCSYVYAITQNSQYYG